jgi:hypothetical protein
MTFYNSPDRVYRLIWDAIEEEDQECWAFSGWKHSRVSGKLVATKGNWMVEAEDLAQLHQKMERINELVTTFKKNVCTKD